MSSIAQHLSDTANIADVVEKPSAMHAMSTSAKERLRNVLLSDSYQFTLAVCRHHDLVPEIHMPISYAACGLADKLAWCITQSGFESYVIEQFRRELRARRIDPKTPQGVEQLQILLNFVNFRVSRGTFKSSVITHGGVTFTATRDPNTTNKLTSSSDPKAWQFNNQIGETLRSGLYRDIFPERVPEGNLNELITQKRATLGGRTISHPQTTIEAGGYMSKDIGAHYDHFWTDDLVVEENATVAAFPGVEQWLTNMPGLFMLTSLKANRLRRIFVGTRWDDENGNATDDHHWLTTGNRAVECLTIFVPIEVHEGEVESVLQRGTPTMPSFIPEPMVQVIQNSVLSSEGERKGIRSWRNNYLLNPQAGGAQFFTESLVNDPDRMYQTRAAKMSDGKYDPSGKFYVRRYARDEQGRPIHKTTGKPLAQYEMVNNRKAETKWRDDAKVLTLNPWSDMDRVMTIDPSYAGGGDRWAVTVAGIDYDGVKYPLETMAGEDGQEGWIEAADDLEKFYRPRVIGFGAGGMQKQVVPNMFQNDPRLRRMKSRLVPVSEAIESKKARIRNGVLEPLKIYKILLPPHASGEAGDFGAQIIRDEMIGYKGDKKAVDAILDTLWMIDAVAKRKQNPEDYREEMERRKEMEARYRRSVDPVLGIPMEGVAA